MTEKIDTGIKIVITIEKIDTDMESVIATDPLMGSVSSIEAGEAVKEGILP